MLPPTATPAVDPVVRDLSRLLLPRVDEFAQRMADRVQHARQRLTSKCRIALRDRRVVERRLDGLDVAHNTGGELRAARTMPALGAGAALVAPCSRRRARCAVVRKISLTLVIVVGAFWVAGALAADYPKKTQAVDNLTNSFRPDFTDSALAQSAADLRTSKTFADDFRTKAAPALAQQSKVTPDQFVAFPSKARFASWNGTAPIDASSGDYVRHRLSRGGNRQINRVLHIMATVQLRNPTEGRAYFDGKKAAGKTSMEAMRALKRRLSDIVYRQLLADAIRPSQAGPGGHPGTTIQSSAADSHPDIDTSDQSLPGPATNKPRTDLAAAS